MAERSSSNNNREKSSVVHLHTKGKKEKKKIARQRKLAPVSSALSSGSPTRIPPSPIIADEIVKENETRGGGREKLWRLRGNARVASSLSPARNRKSPVVISEIATYRTPGDVSARDISVLSRAACPLPLPVPPPHVFALSIPPVPGCVGGPN